MQHPVWFGGQFLPFLRRKLADNVLPSFFLPLSLLLLGDLSGILVLFSKSGNFESRFLHIIARKKINRIKSVPSNSSIGFGHSSHESKSESVLPFPAGL